MSVLQSSLAPDSLAAQVSLNRLHLLYRFDLRQRTWVLQALEIRSGHNSPFPAGLAALASAIARNISDFSDPAQGGDHPVKTVSRRTETLTRTNQLNARNRNCPSGGLFNAKETRCGRRTFSAACAAPKK
jgi:hypothetical protein